MRKSFGLAFVALALCLASLPLVAQDAKAKPKRLEVSELVVRDPETGNSVTILADTSTAGIWVTNKRLGRSVAMVSTGHTRKESQTFVSVYSDRQLMQPGGRGFNWAVSLGQDDEPVEQVSGDRGIKIREIKIK